ncbi:MAG: WbqC family protein [Haliscomenobacter sp.]|nr:WbqC family protein [Haliscomenobacter sp.]MBK7476338.1 WbqC family protein [Haliscomenobacter sp.]MBK8879207.1 WbqC family protein [Haliscomenobacter sp.]
MVSSALLLTAYAPPASYVAQCLRFPRVVIEQWENYQKGSFRNRCHIASSHGVLRLSIPLWQGKHQRMPIREVRIDHRERWAKNHLETLVTAYGSAPFFEEYYDLFEPVYLKRPAFLFDLNLELLQAIAKALRIPCAIELSREYERIPMAECADLRQAISPKERNMHPGLLGWNPIAYPQVFEEKHGFLPDLSIFDMLFCLGPESILNLNEGLTDIR